MNKINKLNSIVEDAFKNDVAHSEVGKNDGDYDDYYEEANDDYYDNDNSTDINDDNDDDNVDDEDDKSEDFKVK